MSNKLNYLDKKGLAKVFSILKFGHKKIWHGTLAEWEALSATEKAKYDQAEVIDEYTGVPVVVDKVESGNLNPVTSNAVAEALSDAEVVTPEYIRNQNILSDWEDITISTDSASPTVMQYDGFIYSYTGNNVILYINTISFHISKHTEIPGDGACMVAVRKGDRVYINRDKDSIERVAYYKLRDYTGR